MSDDRIVGFVFSIGEVCDILGFLAALFMLLTGLPSYRLDLFKWWAFIFFPANSVLWLTYLGAHMSDARPPVLAGFCASIVEAYGIYHLALLAEKLRTRKDTPMATALLAIFIIPVGWIGCLIADGVLIPHFY